MGNSLFPSDDELPTWLHTLLLLLLVSPFALILLWWGVGAIASGQLEPKAGPELGYYFFGTSVLYGATARLAGFAFLVLSAGFWSIALSFSRMAADSRVLKILPWVLLTVFIVLSVSINAQLR